MFMQKSHPDFDLPLELLCTLPTAPAYAEASTLVRDLGLASSVELTAIISRLRDRGYNIRTGNAAHLTQEGDYTYSGRLVALEPAGASVAQAAADAYWDAMGY